MGPFGFPATARILNNAIAKLLLGWEKSPGAGRPRLDLAEGAFNPAACRAGAGPRGSGKVEGALEGLGSLPGQDGNRVAAGRPRGGYGAPQQPVSLRLGAAHSRPSPRRWPRATLLPAALRQPPGVHGGLRGSRPSRAPQTPARAPRLEAPQRAEPQSARAGPLGGRGRGGKPEPRPPRSRPSSSPRRGVQAARPSPFLARPSTLTTPRRAPGALPLSFAGSSLRQSYKRCFHRWWQWKRARARVCVRARAWEGRCAARPVIWQRRFLSL